MSIVARAQKSNERKSREVVEMFAIVVTFYLFLNVSSSSSWMSWQARPTMKRKNDSFHPSIHPPRASHCCSRLFPTTPTRTTANLIGHRSAVQYAAIGKKRHFPPTFCILIPFIFQYPELPPGQARPCHFSILSIFFFFFNSHLSGELKMAQQKTTSER